MAWIEAHQELRDHPKTKRAARLLGISRPQMIGHLLCLWWWSLDYADDGDLSDFDAADIADAAEWDGDADTFVSALVNCGPADRPGFLVETGGGLEIRDWSQYGGKYITKRNQGRDRQRAWRERNAQAETSNADVTRYESVSNTPREDKIREDHITEEKGETGRPTNQNANQIALPQDTEAAAALQAVEDAFGQLRLPQQQMTMDDILTTFDEFRAAGRADWWKAAIDESLKYGGSSWSYMFKVLSSAKQKGHKPGYVNGTGSKGKCKGKPEQQPNDYDSLKARYVPAGYEDIIDH